MLLVALTLVALAVLLWPDRPRPSFAEESSATGGMDAGTQDAGRLGAGGLAADGQAADRLAAGEGTADARGSTPVTVDAAADALVLCALALRSGLGPVEALEAVAERVPAAVGRQLRVVASAHRWGQDAATAWAHVGDGWQSASLAWQAAERSGAAPAGVVLAAAGRLRRQEASRVEAAVQRAGVLLVLPLGACFLPGFVGTTVVPVVLQLAGASLGSTT